MSRKSTAAPNALRRAGRLARQGIPVMQLGTRRLLGRKSPFQMTLSLTNRCNFKCVYCDIPLQKRDELSLQEWKTCIDEFRHAGMGRVSLIGGEPLIHKAVGPIIDHLVKHSIHTAMNTNGWHVPERIEDMAKLDLVCLTLDGTREIHDKQRRKGSYDKVIDALDALHGRDIPVVTMSVLTPGGVDNVDHVLEVAQHYGHKAFFQLEHDKSCDVMAPIAPKLDEVTVATLADKLLALKKRGMPVGNSQMILEQQRDQRYLGSCDDCYAGQYYGYILSDGTVAPCLLTQWQQEKGNGRKHGFAAAFEAMEAPKGPGCSCVPTHEVNQVLAFNLRALWHAVNVTLDMPATG